MNKSFEKNKNEKFNKRGTKNHLLPFSAISAEKNQKIRKTLE
jgi:hypothetical protein